MERDSFLNAAEAEGGGIAGVKISPDISDRKMTFVLWKALPAAGRRARGVRAACVESKLKCSFVSLGGINVRAKVGLDY